MKLPTLKKRSEFLRLRGGMRCAMPAFVLETRPRVEKENENAPARFGFTITKALGKAVDRNRIRRRLKAAITTLAPMHAHAGHDYVLVARRLAIDLPFSQLKTDLEQAFQRIHRSEKRSAP